MTTKEAIRYALGLAEGAFLPAIDAMADAPLTYPTSNGGCHWAFASQTRPDPTWRD